MKYLIVDGYNILFRDPQYSALAQEDIDAARVRLVADIGGLVDEATRVIVVFDAAGNPLSDGRPHRVAGVTVVFSRAGLDADSVIEEFAHRYRSKGHLVTVATSDAATQATVMGEGALRMSAREFGEEVQEARRSVEAHGRDGAGRGRLEDRIDPELRERLSRWARGA